MSTVSQRIEVTDQSFPSESLVHQAAVNTAWYSDSFAAPCRAEIDPPTAFFAVFGHLPAWLKALLLTRNRVASWFGLEVPRAIDITRPQQNSEYAVGDTIGPWPIFALAEHELVAGRDNTHLDFRVSLLMSGEGLNRKLSVSTLCVTHNVFGKAYLCLIVPFHRWGVRMSLRQALTAGRI